MKSAREVLNPVYFISTSLLMCKSTVLTALQSEPGGTTGVSAWANVYLLQLKNEIRSDDIYFNSTADDTRLYVSIKPVRLIKSTCEI